MQPIQRNGGRLCNQRWGLCFNPRLDNAMRCGAVRCIAWCCMMRRATMRHGAFDILQYGAVCVCGGYGPRRRVICYGVLITSHHTMQNQRNPPQIPRRTNAKSTRNPSRNHAFVTDTNSMQNPCRCHANPTQNPCRTNATSTQTPCKSHAQSAQDPAICAICSM